MLLYLLKNTEKTDSKDLRVVKTKNRKIMLLWDCALHGSKKSRFFKEQEANGLITSFVRFNN